MMIYLAGSESALSSYDWRPEPGGNFFLSFYQGKKTLENSIAKLREAKAKTIVIDSGAHSFFAHIGKSVTKHVKPKSSMPDPAKYFAEYEAWLSEHAHLIDYAVELDIQEIVGEPVVREWRERLERTAMARKMIWVYHSFDPETEYARILAECPSRYVGLEGIRPGLRPLPYVRLIKQARDAGCRVHGFAMTKRDAMLQFPFYSVDSASWAWPVRSGKVAVYNSNANVTHVKYINMTPQSMAEAGVAFRPEWHKKLGKSREAVSAWYKLGERAFRRLEVEVTKIWEMRGVTW